MIREEEEEEDRRSASAGGSGKDDAEAEPADDEGLGKAGPKLASFWVSPGFSIAWTGTQRPSLCQSFLPLPCTGPFPFHASLHSLVAPLRTQYQRLGTPV